MNKAKITRVGIVEGDSLGNGWKFSGNSDIEVYSLSVKGIKDYLGYTLDELREISKEEVEDWSLVLSFGVSADGTIFQCDACEMWFTVKDFNYHFLHRKESEDNMKGNEYDKNINRFLYNDGKPKTESPIVLKIRFVLLEKAVVMEVLEQDNEALGHTYKSRSSVKGKPIETSNGWQIGQGSMWGFYIDGLFIGNKPDAPQIYITDGYSFEQIKQALSEFADNGGFHGVDKPVPRIERFDKTGDGWACNGFVLTIVEDERIHITDDIYNYLSAIIGLPIPIYEPKKMFAHSWEKISPREFSVGALPHFPSRFINSNAHDELLDCEDWVISNVNQLEENSIIPEVWQFRMWNNGEL